MDIISFNEAATANGRIDILDSETVKLAENQTISGVKTFSSNIVGNITGNAGTATTLATARTINGVSFDGSANIIVPLSGDSQVNLTEDQTIGGIKTFTSSPIVPTPTTDFQVATKQYVDNNSDIGAITSYSQISGTNTIEGAELTNSIHNVFNDGNVVATYQLDGNANDLGGTYNGVASNVTYEEGKFGQAGKFNGSNSYINGFNFSNMNTTTISTWVKPISLSGLHCVYGQSNSGGSDVSLGVSLFISATTIRIYHNNQTYKEFSYTFTPGTYYHIVHKIEGTIVTIYINNILIGGHDFGVNRLAFNSSTFAFGRSGAYSDYYFNGLIDQVRIFNRALTEAEINTLYSETRVSGSAKLNINQGIFIYPKGLASKGYVKSSDTFTGIVPTSGVSDGWKYVAKDENNNFSFYETKPTLGKTSAELYLKDGKLYKSSDDTAITPISFLSNKVRFVSGFVQELAPSGIAKSATDSIEAKEVFGKNAVLAYALIDMTANPPTILDSYNVSSVVRNSNGVGKVTLAVPTDKDNVTAICSSNAGGGSVTATTKSEISFATATTNQTKTVVIVMGGKN